MSVPGRQISWNSFLKDVFICSLGAYGGPEISGGRICVQHLTPERSIYE